MIVHRYGALKPTQGFDALLQQLRLACRYRNALVELLNWRIIAEQTGADRDALKIMHAEMSRWLRSRSGLGWGTYQLIEQDVQRAGKSPYRAPRKGSGRARWFAQVRELGLDPTRFRARFRRFDGTGRIGANVQACTGLTTDDALAGKGALRLSGASGKALATLNIGLGHVIELPVVAHRQLPIGVQIVRGILCVERVGDRYVYSLHITMRADTPARQYGEGLASVNFGWRSTKEGVRVAYVVGAGGEQDELVLPRRLVDKLRHSESLRALADERAVEASPMLGQDPTEVGRWRARERRRVLRDVASTHRELGRELGEAESPEDWARRDRHLYQWERDEYAKVLRQRREIYRLWSQSLAKKYGSVVVEDFDLPTLIDRDKPVKIPEARHVRFLVAPGYLRAEVKNVFKDRCELAEVKKRTTVCHVCGEELVGDRAREVELWCEQCNAARDQDANNAANQLSDAAAE
jgi:hypothetical protein